MAANSGVKFEKNAATLGPARCTPAPQQRKARMAGPMATNSRPAATLQLQATGGAPKAHSVAEKALDAVHITVNKNTIPFDTNSPFTASGIRLGTPALTTRGMLETEMRLIGKLIASIVREPESEEVKTRVKKDVAELTVKFPLYTQRLKEGKTEAISAN